MNITSTIFILFCILAILIHWRLPAKYRTGWLFAVSMAFLVSWGWQLALIMLVVATVNFRLGAWIGSMEEKRRALMWIGIGFNLLVLIGLRYNNFYVPALTILLERLGIQTGTGGLHLLAPVGLSFIVIQMISYLVDIHNRILKPEPRWLDFALYVVYFPKILAGPVERARTILPVFKQPRPVDAQSAERYFWLIILGLTRKVILADTLSAMIPLEAFAHPESYSGQDLVFYLLGYAFVIYNDFAGYTSIVRGVSGFLGIELTSNFKLPYFARNFAEFWDRWHASLSNWLRDYVFFPSSRSLLKKIPARNHIINLAAPAITTMLVSGMWHGLSWNFILWGGLHGLYLVIERVATLTKARRLPDELPKSRQLISMLVVFALVVLAWIPFRMDILTGWLYFSRMFTPDAWLRPKLWIIQATLEGKAAMADWSIRGIPDVRLFFMFLPAFLLDWVQLRTKNETFIVGWPVWAKALILAITALVLILLSFAKTAAPFVYQGF